MSSEAAKQLLIAKQYVIMARQARTIGRMFPDRKQYSFDVARTYMKLARRAYNTFLITAIYES